jgi:hypothetical protein
LKCDAHLMVSTDVVCRAAAEKLQASDFRVAADE